MFKSIKHIVHLFFIFLRRKLILVSLLFIAFFICSYLVLLKHYPVIINKLDVLISLPIGVFGILIGFEIERFQKERERIRRYRKIFAGFINELAPCIELINKQFINYIRVHERVYKINLWDVYKNILADAGVRQVILLSKIYFYLSALSEKSLEEFRENFDNYQKIAFDTRDNIIEFIEIVWDHYNRKDMKLIIDKDVQLYIRKYTDVDFLNKFKD